MKKHLALQWIENNLVFGPESRLAGKFLKKYILPFQRAIIRSALTSEGEPNKNVFLGWSRKLGKTETFCWILTYLLCRKEGFHTGILASTAEQGEVAFNSIREQIFLNKGLSENYDFKATRERIKCLDSHSSIEKLNFSPDALLGRRFSGIFADELGAHKSEECISALESGLSFAKGGGLVLAASNPPLTSEHWSIGYVDELKKDSDWKIFEYAANPATDPFSKEALKEGNPIYKAYMKTPVKLAYLKPVIKHLEKQRVKAEKSESPLSFLRYQLGRRISTNSESWIEGRDLKVMPLAEVLAKNPSVLLGVDLALSWDFCCASLVFEWEDKTAFHSILHLPNLTGRTPRQQREFTLWHQKGMITIQGRPSLCKDSFVADVKAFIKDNSLNVRATIFDRGLISQVWEDSLRYGKTHLIACTAANLSAAIGELQAQARAGRLFMTEDNDCIRWQFSNALASSRSKGYRLLNRTSRRKSIDCPYSVTFAKWHHLKHPYKRPLIMYV